MRNWLKNKERLLAGTIIAGASVAGLATPAMAQEEASAETEIVVTGSRIPQPNLQSVSPVTQIGSDEIADRGVTRIEDMINQLPQAFGAQNSGISNGATGTATADLRGLGSNRTLSLINGRRLAAGDPGGAGSTGASADLNLIPAALVERVEVLTGGASAVYGADAVAGVVNFLMQDDFEGVRLDAEYSFYQADNSDDETGDLAAKEAVAPRFYRVPDDNVSDGETFGFTAIFGANSEDGRGNVTAYADYRNVKAVLQAERGYSACTFGSGDAFACSGSSTSFPAQISPATQATNFQRGQFVALPGTARLISPTDGSLIPTSPDFFFNFGATNYYQRPDERYSLGAFAHYEINPKIEIYAETMFMDDRSVAQIAAGGLFAGSGSGTLRGNYPVNCDNPFLTPELVDHICNADARPDVYDPGDPDADGDGAADRDEAIAALIAAGDIPGTPEDESDPAAAAALIDGTIGLQPNCPDPDLVTPGNQAVCIASMRTRNVNGEPRAADFRHTQYRFVLGARGELTSGWNYDLSGIYNTVIYQQHYLNEVSLSRVNKALINTGGQCGVNVDADPINDDPACVPLDIFDQSGPTRAQLDYVTASGQMQGSTALAMGSFAITGDLGTAGVASPLAEDGVAVAFGVESRYESLELRPDAAFCPSDDDGVVSDLLGQGTTTCPSDGSYSVIEYFGEAQIPLIQQKPFFHSLGLDMGYRFSDYSISGGNNEASASNSFTTDTYKFGGHWAPTEDFRFRAAFQRASRAPNIIELFTPQAVGLAGTTDPCAGAAPQATLAQCQNTGVAPNQYGFIESNPAAQYNGLLGGAPTLNPEEADTMTIGVVFTPTFVEGLTLSADWYRIQLDRRIGTIGTDTIINQCLATGEAEFCDRIHRAAGSGSLWLSPDGYIVDSNANNGSLETKGVDVEGNYRVDIGESAGRLTINYQGTYIEEYLVTVPPAATIDCVGRHGSACSGAIGAGFGAPMPQYRHKLRIDWQTPWPSLSVSGAWRYYDETTLDEGSAAATGSPPTDLTLAAMNYLDLAATWHARDNVTFRAGVNNVTEEDPPLTGLSNCPAGPCSGNTWPQLYDALGRYVFFGVTADF